MVSKERVSEQTDQGDRERKPFPQGGRTLLVNAIGARGVKEATRFLQALQATYEGSQELLGVATVHGVSPDAKLTLETAFKNAMAHPLKDPLPARLKRMWSLRLKPPVIILGNPDIAVQRVTDRSKEYGDTARVGLHFVSFERGNSKSVKDTLNAYQQGLPQLLHLGILVIPADPLSRGEFEHAQASVPLQKLNMPFIVIDESISPPEKGKGIFRLRGREVMLNGIAGLVAAHRAFPELNPHDYLETLKALTDQSKFIGVGVGQDDTPLFGRRLQLSQEDLRKDAAYAVAISLWPNSSITPYPRKEDTGIEIVSLQLPFNPSHPDWRGSLKHGIEAQIPESSRRFEMSLTNFPNLQIYYGCRQLPSHGRRTPIVATHFFPTKVR